ncbi:MAG: terminase B [Nitrospinota bacterium]
MIAREAELWAGFYAEPERFVRSVLKAAPDPWQGEALRAVAEKPRVAIRAGNGPGKTAVAAWALLWFLATRPYPKVPCTAPKEKQLFDVLWAEVHKWLRDSPLAPFFGWERTRVFFRGDPAEWFAAARTARAPENLQGFHAKDLLFIVDEASGVADPVLGAVEAALTTEGAKALLIGNPIRTSGYFYDTFHKDRALWDCHRVSGLESPRVSQEFVESLRRRYGEESAVFRVRVLGEFPEGDSEGFLPLSLVEAALARELEPEGDVELGVDVARFGGDRTALCVRRGAVALSLWAAPREDLMATCGRIVRAIAEWDARAAKVDEGGLGAGVVDRLREMQREGHEGLEGARIEGVNAARRARHPEAYAGLRDELWGALRARLEAGEIDLSRLAEDDELVAELTTPRFRLTSRGQVKVEGKDELKSRGLASPDKADALILAFAPTFAGPPAAEAGLEPVGSPFGRGRLGLWGRAR